MNAGGSIVIGGSTPAYTLSLYPATWSANIFMHLTMGTLLNTANNKTVF